MHIWYTELEVMQMADFCLECWNKINETQDSKYRYVFSKDWDLCEECGQYTQVIIAERLWSRAQKALAEAIQIRRSNDCGQQDSI
jgi:hydrogenase maturation factor HypF (carbamoyltransferase family)